MKKNRYSKNVRVDAAIRAKRKKHSRYYIKNVNGLKPPNSKMNRRFYPNVNAEKIARVLFAILIILMIFCILVFVSKLWCKNGQEIPDHFLYNRKVLLSYYIKRHFVPKCCTQIYFINLALEQICGHLQLVLFLAFYIMSALFYYRKEKKYRN